MIQLYYPLSRDQGYLTLLAQSLISCEDYDKNMFPPSRDQGSLTLFAQSLTVVVCTVKCAPIETKYKRDTVV